MFDNLNIYHKSLIIIGGTILVLLIINIVYRKKSRSSSAQTNTHILLYLFEILIVTTLINYLILGYQLKNDTPLIILRNHIFAYTLYQLVLFAFFKLRDSIETDALASIKNLVDSYQIFAEFEKEIPSEDIQTYREKFNSPKVTLSKKHRDTINGILSLAENYNDKQISIKDFRFYLKQISRDADFQSKMFNYNWMNSILLRIFK